MVTSSVPVFAVPHPLVRIRQDIRAQPIRAMEYRHLQIPPTVMSRLSMIRPYVRQPFAGLAALMGRWLPLTPIAGEYFTIVNQKLAFSEGFIPCSTIKPVIAVAALEEGFVTRDTKIRVSRRKNLTLTEAMAHSNNAFFEELGRRMGFETVSSYARTLGLGELAGYEIPEEQPGTLPDNPPARGGVGRMSSFGEGILMTPLQLGALVSTVANGGTLYYLQYPRTIDEMENFEPRVSAPSISNRSLPDLRVGMHAAVTRGTARRSNMPDSEEAAGKDWLLFGLRLKDRMVRVLCGQPKGLKLVLVILMRGHTYSVRGPVAAGIAGRIYRELQEDEYIIRQDARASSPVLAAKSGQ